VRYSHPYTLMIMRALFLHKIFIRDFHHPLLPLSRESILILFSPSSLPFLLSRNLTYPSMLLKDWRRRPEGGEWEPIKIPQENLAYIPKSTRCPALLTQLRPHSYGTAIGPRNWVRNCSGNMNWCQQDHVRDRRKKSDHGTVYILTGISPNTWWARSGNHRERTT
jgi:hypothetical protein